MRAKPPYKIGLLAQNAGVPISAVRYYERTDLVRPDLRGRAGYRLYVTAALDKLRAIRAHQRAGLTLRDIGQLLAVAEGRSAPRKIVQPIVATAIGGAGTRATDSSPSAFDAAQLFGNVRADETPQRAKGYVPRGGDIRQAFIAGNSRLTLHRGVTASVAVIPQTVSG